MRVFGVAWVILLFYSGVVAAQCSGTCYDPDCDEIVLYVDSAIHAVNDKSPYLTSYLVMGVIKAESSFHQCNGGGGFLTSSSGAVGLMQLLSDTASDMGVDRCNPQDNILGGTRYLNWLLTDMNYEDYETPTEFTLAAYNCGPRCVDRRIEQSCPGIWANPPTMSKSECGYGDEVPASEFPDETRNYVSRITGWLKDNDVDCEGKLPIPEGEYIVSVTHNIVGDEIDITVRIHNPTEQEINVRAYVLRGYGGEEMEHEPNVGWESIQPGGETTITLTSSGDPEWNVHSLGGSYRIRVDDRDKGEMDISGIKYVATAPTGVYPEECVCDCNGLVLNLISQEGFCELTCARACGAHTNCRSDCENCCEIWCSGKGNECVEACMERCQMTSGIDDLVEAIKSAVIIIAAIIFALCSIQYLIAGNPESRNWAKKCITYVIIGLIIIGLALLIVELFGGMVEPSGDKCVRDESCDELCGKEGYSNDAGATCYSDEDCTIKCFGECVPTPFCDKECGGAGYSNDEGRTCYKEETCSIVCPELPEFNGPVPFDDRCTIWECVETSTSGSFCEKWNRTDTGWVCIEEYMGVYKFCREWKERTWGWECKQIAERLGSCGDWHKTTTGWWCYDNILSGYCEVWHLKGLPNGWGWECIEEPTFSQYCEKWEKDESKDKWTCTSGGLNADEFCIKWRCGDGEGDVKIKIVVEDESTSNP